MKIRTRCKWELRNGVHKYQPILLAAGIIALRRSKSMNIRRFLRDASRKLPTNMTYILPIIATTTICLIRGSDVLLLIGDGGCRSCGSLVNREFELESCAAIELAGNDDSTVMQVQNSLYDR